MQFLVKHNDLNHSKILYGENKWDAVYWKHNQDHFFWERGSVHVSDWGWDQSTLGAFEITHFMFILDCTRQTEYKRREECTKQGEIFKAQVYLSYLQGFGILMVLTDWVSKQP